MAVSFGWVVLFVCLDFMFSNTYASIPSSRSVVLFFGFCFAEEGKLKLGDELNAGAPPFAEKNEWGTSGATSPLDLQKVSSNGTGICLTRQTKYSL